MPNTPEVILGTWLSEIGIRVSKPLLKQQVKSHPDYPSLLSITDTLDYFGIGYDAVRIEKDLLHEVATPFLAHLRSNRGEFVIIRNRDTIAKNYPEFFDNWSGVTLSVEKPAELKHEANENALKQEKISRYRKLVIGGFIIILSFITTIFSSYWVLPALLLIAYAGIFISWLIISKELGIENKIAEQVCGRKDDCGAVIHSKKAKLPFGIAWGDIGLSWFLSVIAMLTVSSFAGNYSAVLSLLSILSAAALPFTFLSLYYQWRIERKWCRLCLITVGLLWAQFGILIPSLPVAGLQANLAKEIVFISSIITVVGMSWFYLKKLWIEKIQQEKESFEGIRFRKNEKVVKALFAEKKKVHITPWKGELQLGNAAADIQITVACDTYCGPCARMHKQLHELVGQFAGKFGLTVRFFVSPVKKEDKRVKAVGHILQHIENFTTTMGAIDKAKYTREVLHQWFEWMNQEKFDAKFSTGPEINVESLLQKHDQWMSENKILYTPTLFINGRELPAQYTADDLSWLIYTDPEIFSDEETELISA